MATGNKRVMFTFEGNTSGLHSAVNKGVQDLQRFARSMQNMSKTTSMGSVTNSAASSLEKMSQQMDELSDKFKNFNHKNGMPEFKKAFEETEKAVSGLVTKYKDLDTMKVSDTSALTDMQQKLQNVSELFDSMGSNTQMSYKTIEEYSAQLNRMNSALNASITSFNLSQQEATEWRLALDNVKRKTSEIKESFNSLGAYLNRSLSMGAATIDSKFGTNLTGLLQKAQDVKNQFPEMASNAAAAFARAQGEIEKASNSLQRFLYKVNNYSDIQKEMQRNKAAVWRYENAEPERRRKMKPQRIKSEDEIIDEMMAQGKGSGRSGQQLLKGIGDVFNSVMKNLSKMGSTLGTITAKVGSSLKSLGSSIGSIVGKVTGFTSSIHSANNGLQSFGNIARRLPGILNTIAGAIIGFKISDIFSEATARSIELVENLNLFIVSMGQSAEAAQRFVDTMAEMYGMNPSNLYRYAGYFAQITGAIGLTDEAAMKLSTSMTKMANDIASLYNMEIQDVVENLGSGLQGLNQAVRKYGIDMRQTTIQQTAFKYGLTDNVATMSEANRIVLRYLTMIEQMRNATRQVTTDVDGSTRIMGDFARNIETPANQLRIFKEQCQQLATTIGSFLIPVLQRVLPILNGLVAAIRIILSFFATLFGIDVLSWGGEISAGADLGAGGLDNLGDAASSAAGKMKQLVAPFDELNILADNLGSGGGAGGGLDFGEVDPRLLEALEALQLQLDKVRLKAWEIRDAILEVFGLTPDGKVIADGFIDSIVYYMRRGNWSGIGHAIAQLMNKGIDWANNNITWDKLGSGIEKFDDIWAGIFNGWLNGINAFGAGNVAANLVNIFFHFIDDAITKIHWDELGRKLGDFVNGLLLNIEWDTVFNTISDALNSRFTWLLNFAKTLQWKNIAQVIVDGLNEGIANFESDTLGQALGEFVKGGIDFLATFVGKLNMNLVADKLFEIISNMVDTVAGKFDNEDDSNRWYTLGSSITGGISKAIEAVNKAIAKWGDMGLTDALFNFIEGAIKGIKGEEFKTAIDNVINGIIRFFTRFRERFSVKDLSNQFFTWLQETIGDISWDELATDITSFMNDLLSGFNKAVTNYRTTHGKDLIDVFFDFVEDMITKFNWSEFSATLTTWAFKLGGKLIELIGAIKWGDIIAGFFTGMVNAINDPKNTGFENVANALIVGLSLWIGTKGAIPAGVAGAIGLAASGILDRFSEAMGTKNDSGWEKIAASIVGAAALMFLGVPPQLAVPLGIVGKDIVLGLWDAIKEGFTFLHGAAQWLTGKIAEILGEAINGLFGSNTFGDSLIEWGNTQIVAAEADWERVLHDQQGFFRDKVKEEGELNREAMYGAFKAAGGGGFDALNEFATEVPEVVNPAIDSITENLVAKWGTAELQTQNSWKNIHGNVKKFSTDLNKDGTKNINELTTTATTNWQSLDTDTSTKWNNIETTVTESATSMHKAASEQTWAIFEDADVAFQKIINETPRKDWYGTGKKSIQNLDQGIQDAWKPMEANVNTGTNNIITSIKSMFTNSEYNSLAQSLVNLFTNTFSAIQRGASDMKSDVASAYKAAHDDMKNINQILREANSSSREVSNALSDSTQALRDLEQKYAQANTLASKTNTINQVLTTNTRRFAEGGVVTGPTRALIGEAGRSEAVLPLDDSPQMTDLIQKIADAVKGGGGSSSPGEPVSVQVFIGDKEWDAFTYQSAKRGEKIIGDTPVEVTT